MTSNPECPLVLVEWEDSRQPDPGWVHLAGADPGEISKCTSVGWLIYDGPEKKVLAPNMADIEDEQNIQVCGIIQIPASCVTRIVRVEESEEG